MIHFVYITTNLLNGKQYIGDHSSPSLNDSYLGSGKAIKSAIRKLTDSVRHFRNLVHLELEKDRKHSISKATAKGAVSSIFTIANDF